MLATLSQDLSQPEYIHVLLNPIPVYGLTMGIIGLIIALFLRSRPAQIATLALILLSGAIVWPVVHYGEAGYDRVLAMADAMPGSDARVGLGGPVHVVGSLSGEGHRADRAAATFSLSASSSAGPR